MVSIKQGNKDFNPEGVRFKSENKGNELTAFLRGGEI